MVHGADTGGGAELLAHSLQRELRDMGHRVRLFVGRKEGADADVVQIPPRRGPAGALRLARWLERRFGLQYLYSPSFRDLPSLIASDTQVLHLHSLHGVAGYADLAVVPQLCRRWPTVVTLHDMWLFTGHCAHSGPCERWSSGCGHCPDLTLYPAIQRDGTHFNWLRKRHYLARSPMTVVCPSRWLADKAALSPLLSGKEIVVIPNAVDTRICFPSPDRRALRRALDLRVDDFIVLFVAHQVQSRWKGTLDAVQAMNGMARPVFGVIVGRGSDSATAGLQVAHRALPYLDQRRLADWYRAADVLLVSSQEEVFGMVAAEAMACGTTVVAYDVGGLPEVIADTGMVVSDRQPPALARALDSLANDTSRCAQLGRLASARARQLFAFRAVALQYSSLYHRVREDRYAAGDAAASDRA